MTTDNLPAVRDDEAPVSRADTDSWIPVASDVIRLANLIAPTEFVPRSLRDSAPATAAAILYGREVGLPPMTALTQTHVIEGRPAMSAEAMRALVLAAGHSIEVVETTRARCELRGRRRGQERWTAVVVTVDEFRHLTGNPKKPNWQLYTRQMLQARASVELCRLVFPDVIHGFRAVEEFDDLDDPQAESTTPAPTTRVTRKRAAAKRSAPASTPLPLEQRPETPLSGPPLPGEDGYETSPGGEAPAGDEAAELSAPPPGEAGPAPDGGAADTAAAAPTAPQDPPAGEGEGEAPEPAGGPVVPIQRGPRRASKALLRMLFARLKEITGDDLTDEDRHDIATAVLGHRVNSFEQLTSDNVRTLLDTLARVEDREQLDAILSAAAGGTK